MHEYEETWWRCARLLAVHTPQMVICFLGMILAVAKWRRAPRAAILSFFGFGILLAAVLGTLGFLFWEVLWGKYRLEFIPNYLVERVLGIISFFSAVAYSLLITAIYIGRKPRAPVPGTSTPEGVEENSRGLSAAIPPETGTNTFSIPEES